MKTDDTLSKDTPQPFANPYLAGVLLGTVLLASFVVLGAGLGASGGIARIGAYFSVCVAPLHTLGGEYFSKWGGKPLNYYLVLMFVGTFIGGMFSALLANRTKLQVERGRAASAGKRLCYALVGGILAGFASRLAQGCTSGQALSGGALLLTGSLVFLGCTFAGGFATAWFFRRQWHD